jgi:hypothetical protein
MPSTLALLRRASVGERPYSLSGAKVSDVVRDEKARARTDRCGEDRDVLRVRELTRAFLVLRRRPVDLESDRAEEFLEERGRLGKLVGQVPSDLSHRGLR